MNLVAEAVPALARRGSIVPDARLKKSQYTLGGALIWAAGAPRSDWKRRC